MNEWARARGDGRGGVGAGDPSRCGRWIGEQRPPVAGIACSQMVSAASWWLMGLRLTTAAVQAACSRLLALPMYRVWRAW